MPNIEHIHPTRGFEVDEFNYQGKKVNIWDLSGEQSYQGIWKNYLQECTLAVLLIDGSDHSQEGLAKLSKMFEKINFLDVKKLILFFTKSDLKEFNMISILDLLNEVGIMKNIISFDQISVFDADLKEKLIFHVFSALNFEKK